MIYVTSDLHGYPLKKFQKLLADAGFGDEDYLFILGDVIDRGEEGVEILKWLLVQPNVQLILGNHEAMMLECDFLLKEITDQSLVEFANYRWGVLRTWRANGGDSTLSALRKEPQEVKESIFEYLRDCPLYDTVSVGDKNYLLVHGGLGDFSEDKKLSEYIPHDFLWARPYFDEEYSKKFITILGHTPTGFYGAQFNGKILHRPTWINVDVGCARGLPPALLRLDDMAEFYGD